MSGTAAGDSAGAWRIAASAVRSHPRQVTWQELELTAFFHFGVNTFTGREWGSGRENPDIFRPETLDCDQWIRSIKAAGFRLAIITAKHHDGFCLWPGVHTKHSVASSGWRDGRGDVVKEFVDACRRHGILPGVYLSPWDRHDCRYGTPEYNDYFCAQLEELIDGYGPFAEFWFDGACAEGANGRKQVYDWERYYRIIREKQPDAVIAIIGPDVRWVGNESGLAKETQWSTVPESEKGQGLIEKAFEDFRFEGVEEQKSRFNLRDFLQSHRATMWLAPERKVPAAGPPIWYPSECDVSIRPGWFYHRREDRLVKSLKKLLRIYHASVGRNSVLLLNIPPDRRGLLHENDVRRLAEFGRTIHDIYSDDLAADAGRISGGTPDRPEIILRWEKPIFMDRIVLSEDINFGQQVESFVLETPGRGGWGWRTVARGTTIGYKRIKLLRRRIRSDRLRLRITSSRAQVRIRAFAAYLAPKGRVK